MPRNVFSQGPNLISQIGTIFMFHTVLSLAQLEYFRTSFVFTEKKKKNSFVLSFILSDTVEAHTELSP